jgi:hypothetical protein
MQPIHELLARIRHDLKFGKAEFEVGYLDRVDDTIHQTRHHVSGMGSDSTDFSYMVQSRSNIE